LALERLGLLKTSLLDYPGEVAAVLFTHGCNLRCPYCHNPKLISGRPPEDFLPWEEIKSFLEKRKTVLGGVVVTGGEPLLHLDLPPILRAIRELGLKVKVDTNGTKPDALRGLDVDYIAMDFKGGAKEYGAWGGSGSFELIKESLAILDAGSVPYELRLTWVHGIHDLKLVHEMAGLVPRGATLYLTAFRAGEVLNPKLGREAEPKADKLVGVQKAFQGFGINALIR
jgi:pyruvate formate lyase activating enzyme